MVIWLRWAKYKCAGLADNLKGYSGESLIHGLTHRETVLDSLLRDQVCRSLANVVLASSEMTARQQYIHTIHCSKWVQI